VLTPALGDLPERQRAVAERDVHGFEAEEVFALLDLTPANQRVLLHRGRGLGSGRLVITPAPPPPLAVPSASRSEERPV